MISCDYNERCCWIFALVLSVLIVFMVYARYLDATDIRHELEVEQARLEQRLDQLLAENSRLRSENAQLLDALNEQAALLEAYDAELSAARAWDTIENVRVTYYCPCRKCCGQNAQGITATGTVATEGRTVAVDPSVIPLGSEVEMFGHVYIAEDTGVTGYTVDIFLDSHDECIRRGIETITVHVRTPGTAV